MAQAAFREMGSAGQGTHILIRTAGTNKQPYKNEIEG